MNFFNKKTFHIEITELENIEPLEVEGADQLINAVIELNERFITSGESGHLLAEKYLSTKKKDTRLYAMRLDFPMAEDTDFDALLYDFHTRKPLDFKLEAKAPVIMPQEENKVKAEANPAFVQVVERFDDEAVEADSEPSTALEETAEKVAPPVEQSPETAPEVLTREEVASIVADTVASVVAEKEDEINRLKALLEQKEQAPAPTRSKESPEEVIHEQSSNDDTNTIIDDELITVTPSDDDIQDVIATAKAEMKKQLDRFVSSEKNQIDEDMKLLDKRDKIEEELTAKSSLSLEVTLENIKTSLKQEKDQLVTEENNRHKEKLASLDTQFSQSEKEQIEEATQTSKEKLASDIEAERERQTKQLERIYQAKAEELKIRQKEVNDGLKTSMKDALTGFNTAHNQVIKDIEFHDTKAPLRAVVGLR
ncbi:MULTISPECIES: hypothetical protein [unclassified Lactococcus]|uniref:hypothetical protein n=1 Tax=unclassified Lactococcus TaxID=2643510 RepID=UPI0011C90140|nr:MULTISPECIES: hypothetical protein [unclassified Lactococcus]MQW23430.1 hypothetical protein [Lactococcus sp. dk101]TXK37058.1 hypothetical protein FVP42_10050 [Lactococcus sp. dk310]TXK37290.1 hypothetical protein FVP42_09280 [Lactococcus sp. dk310]TXK47714.1 hypothetical protein FVP43_09805 [Lactococcus sp. dk322]